MSSGLDQQLSFTRDQIQQRLSMGDRLDVPREVDHSAEFRKRGSAEEAAGELRALGYRVSLGKRGLFKVLLEASKITAVDEATAAAFTREVYGVVAKHDGSYDGWGGEVEQ